MDRARRRVGAAALWAWFFLVSPDAVADGMRHDLVGSSRLSVEQCVSHGRLPQDCRFVPMHLAEAEARALRDVFTTAHDRQEREEREAARHGQVTGGVWGFVSYSYRILFDVGGDQEIAWLHLSGEAAWLDGDDRAGNLAFTASESGTLRNIVARLVPLAEVIVGRLPVEVAWRATGQHDLNCDGMTDSVFVGRDGTHYYVAAVVAPVVDSTGATYVRFVLHGQSQDAFCGEPRELQEEGLDLDLVEALGYEPEGWQRSASCKGLRLETGDCDSFHLFWNAAQKTLDWWRL